MSREVMKQALEALEERYVGALRDKAMDALRAALDAPEPVAFFCLTDKEIDEIYVQHHNKFGECISGDWGYERAIEARLKEKNT